MKLNKVPARHHRFSFDATVAAPEEETGPVATSWFSFSREALTEPMIAAAIALRGEGASLRTPFLESERGTLWAGASFTRVASRGLSMSMAS